MSVPQQGGPKLGLRSQAPGSSQSANQTNCAAFESSGKESDPKFKEKPETCITQEQDCVLTESGNGVILWNSSDHQVAPTLSLYTRGS